MSGQSLPNGWSLSSYSDIFLSASNGVGGKQNKDGNGIPVSRIETIAEEIIDYDRVGFLANYDKSKVEKHLLLEGDILFSHINSPTHLGKTAIYTGEQILYHGINLLRIVVNRKLVLPQIVNYHCKYIRALGEFSSRAQHAVNQSSLNQKKLGEFEFPLPPLVEQKVIAEKLDTLLAQVETTKDRLESTLETLKQFRQSVLAAAVSGKLTEDWREQSNQRTKEQLLKELLLARKNRWIDEQVKNAARQEKIVSKDSLVKKYKAPSQAYLDELNLTLIHEVPDSWLVTNLDSVAIAVTGKTPSTKDERYWRGDIPFISPSQISPEGHILEPERYVTELGSTKSPVLPEGSILIVCIGTIGKVGLLDRECVFNQQINALIPSSAIKKEFLYMWAKTLHSWLNKTSSAVVNAAIINKSRLCSAPCPLPSIEEQEEIVIRAEKLFLSAHVAEQKVNQALERVNNLTQSILAKAFRGELTEQWRKDNPELISGDNSAEALLKKIKAERAAAKPKRKTKK